MRIVAKIWLCFGVLVSGYLLTVGLTELRSREDAWFLDELERQSIPDVMHAGNAAIGFKQVMAGFQDGVVFGDADGVARAQLQAREVLSSLDGIIRNPRRIDALTESARAVNAEFSSFMTEAVPLYLQLAMGDPAPDLPAKANVLTVRSRAIAKRLASLEENTRRILARAIDERRGNSQRDRAVGEIILVTVLLGSILLTMVLLRSLSRRLRNLTIASERLRTGDYRQPISDHAHDEVGQLASGFEAMRDAVARRDQELKNIGSNLEQLVKERTQELERRNDELLAQIAERQRMERSLRLVESAVAQVDDGVLIAPVCDLQTMIADYANPAFKRVLELGADDQIVGRCLIDLVAGSGQGAHLERAWNQALAGTACTIEIIREHSDQRRVINEWTIAPLRETGGRVSGVAVILRDLTERRQAEMQRQQGQKMESVGQLAAGVAHEINTPIQFIGDNLRFLSDSFKDLIAVVEIYQRLTKSSDVSIPRALAAEMESAAKRADLDYLHGEIPKAISQSLDGIGRVAEIVRAMKEFSHPDRGDKKPTDLNHAIQTTLTVARNEYKYVADLVTDLAPDLPPVPCIVGEINQVVLNLVVNAAHAIADVVSSTNGRGTITISSRARNDCVEIRIADTGGGIPVRARAKIFDPFFTTKPVGKGTGQGLYIAHNVVVKKHGGTLTFETELNKGTTFLITLPLKSD
jgi:PAS domain S-box-containing protein